MMDQMMVLTHGHLFATERIDEPNDSDDLFVRTMRREDMRFLFGMLRWNDWDVTRPDPIEDGDDSDLPFRFRTRIPRRSFAGFVERCTGMKEDR